MPDPKPLLEVVTIRKITRAASSGAGWVDVEPGEYLVTASKRMSAGTTRHTLLVVDPTTGSLRKAGEQCDVDEVPVEPFDRTWEEV